MLFYIQSDAIGDFEGGIGCIIGIPDATPISAICSTPAWRTPVAEFSSSVKDVFAGIATAPV